MCEAVVVYALGVSELRGGSFGGYGGCLPAQKGTDCQIVRVVVWGTHTYVVGGGLAPGLQCP